MKLISILMGQTTYLEQWPQVERDHSSSLSGTIEALKASTLHLPIVSGAKADILEVKHAVGSAVDVMQAVGSSICSLLSKGCDVDVQHCFWQEDCHSLLCIQEGCRGYKRDCCDRCLQRSLRVQSFNKHL